MLECTGLSAVSIETPVTFVFTHVRKYVKSSIIIRLYDPLASKPSSIQTETVFKNIKRERGHAETRLLRLEAKNSAMSAELEQDKYLEET